MAAIARTVPTIGVFGSDTPGTAAIARLVGAAIVQASCIPLSGSSGPGDRRKYVPEKYVKDAAIAGAREASVTAPWIGVENGEELRNPTFHDEGSALVLHPGIGHKRNYLEACLCDGAIAFEGGPGTLSEVTFCLALGRPVVLVGSAWNVFRLNPRLRPSTFRQMIDPTTKRMALTTSGNASGIAYVDSRASEKNLEKALASSPLTSTVVSPDVPPNDVVNAAVQLIDSRLSGEFPEISKEYAAIPLLVTATALRTSRAEKGSRRGG